VRKNQIIDTGVSKKLLDEFEMMLNKQAAFFMKVKQVDKPVFH
jgi:predicted RNA binding protein with dsRBD fold (UPF0201 family)